MKSLIFNKKLNRSCLNDHCKITELIFITISCSCAKSINSYETNKLKNSTNTLESLVTVLIKEEKKNPVDGLIRKC